jgi:hypothetical protein
MISVVGAVYQATTGRLELPKHTCLFYRKEGYSVGAVELDIILSENHGKDARVTENPLQDGRAVSDGIYLELREGSFTALVSNHSLKHLEPVSEQTTDALLGLAQWQPLKNRAREAWEELKSLMDRKELVTIVTALEVYDNVAITHVGAPRDGDSGDSQEFEISFKEVKKVQLREDKVSAQVQPSDMGSDINRQAAVGTSGGQQVGGEPTEADKEQLILGVQ